MLSGIKPIATKTAETFNLISFFKILSKTRTKETEPDFPPISEIVELSFKAILLLFCTASYKIFSPLILSLRIKIVTLLHMFDKNSASSNAVFPAPTTATSLSLKKAPSHVAQ